MTARCGFDDGWVTAVFQQCDTGAARYALSRGGTTTDGIAGPGVHHPAFAARHNDLRGTDASKALIRAIPRISPRLQEFSTSMASFKDPGFQERTASANDAKLKALEKLRAKPAIDPAVAAERAAARAAKEEAERAKRQAKRDAEEEAKAAKKAAAAEAAARALEAEAKSQMSDADKKALRDAKYAARKAKKK